jgi:hypothetical protein
MKRELSELDRLDLAARAQVTEAVAAYARVAMIVVSVFTVLLAFGSEASFYETLVSIKHSLTFVSNYFLAFAPWRDLDYRSSF